MSCRDLTRRAFGALALAAGLGAHAAAALAPEQAAVVGEVEGYFNGIHTLEADFRQRAPDGGVTSGKLFMVKLEGDVTVRSVEERPSEVDVTLVRTEDPDQGKVMLTLSRSPMRLVRWSVTDAQGLTTEIDLDQIRTGVELDRKLFVWRDPKLFGFPED
jgi:outer membrane lipoprotein-sorting protein